jgi:hypothetical protein
MGKRRKVHIAAFKAKVAVVALSEQKKASHMMDPKNWTRG